MDTLLIDASEGYVAAFEEMRKPVIALSFDYAGTVVSAADPGRQLLVTTERGLRLIERDLAAETRARYLLESFGAVDLACVERIETPVDCDADYLVQLDDDVHALCSFGAYALPQLRAMGWRLQIDDSYPVVVVDTTTPWYANLEPDAELDDWFSLELGVEIDGQRVNLMPALLDIVEGSGASSLEEMAGSRRKFVAIPLGDKRYLPVPPERVQVLLRVLLELWEGDCVQPAIQFPATRGGSLAALDEAFDPETPLAWKGSDARRSRALALSSRPTAVDAPPKLRATLRPYQRDGLAWLQHLRAHDVGGILADDMGLGKTLQTIAHLATEKAAGRTDRPSLVIAPTSLIGNWSRELRKFAPHLRVVALSGPSRHALWDDLPIYEVVLISYPLLVRDIERLAEYEFHYVICDEAQAIKNARSRSARAVRRLDARHRLCLTGTPVENNLGELWSQFDFVMPGFLGDEGAFRSMFRTPIERDGDENRMAALRGRVAPFILRRMKSGVVPDLPPKTEIVRPVELTGDQRDLYESIRLSAHASVRTAIRKKGFAASTVAILDALMKLRQVCCDPRLVAVDTARDVDRSAKHEMLFELLGKQLAHGRRVLIFSQFTSMLALIAHGLVERNIPYVSLTGSTRSRERVVDQFEQGEVDVFLISLKAGGTGLNLVSADTVIHYDPWWNPAVQAQATDRAYRIGQHNPVFVYKLIVAGSVEERMLQLQDRKRWLADSLLQPGGAGMDWDESEIDDLFAPLDT